MKETMKEFPVNEYIKLKLENDKTNIYVNGQLFRKCTFLLINIPIEEVSSFDDIESIDEAIERLDRSLEQRKIEIPPDTEFWGHCSNLQVWAENNYNTKLLAQNLAFPLLKKLSSLDPTANRIFKEEIAKRFCSGNKTVIQFLLKEKYIDYLEIQEEREAIFYDNNESIKKLIDDFLNRIGNLKPHEQKILKTLIKLGDTTIKERILDLLHKALTPKDLDSFNPEYMQIYFKYFLGNKENKELLFYENNPYIRNIIDKTIDTEKYILRIGIPFLLMLTRLGDKKAIQLYKDAVLKLFFAGNSTTIDQIILTYLFKTRAINKYNYKNTQLTQQFCFFSYNELEALAEDQRSPEQFFPHWNKYKEKSNTIISFTKESFIPRKGLLKGTDFLSKLKIPDSDYFILIKDERNKRKKSNPIPIYDRRVKKIIINSTESPIKSIIEKIEYLKSHLELIYETYHCTNILPIGTKNSYELYFLDRNKLNNEDIKKMFTSISKGIKVRIIAAKDFRQERG